MKKIFTAILLLQSFFSHAQIDGSSEWTWMKGDNTPNSLGIYGTQGIAAATNKPGARQGSVTWRDLSGNLWLFGGTGYAASGNGELNDLWKYDPVSNLWTWVNGNNTINSFGVYGTKGVAASTNKPGARYQLVSWTDAAGNFWLFGGLGFAASGSEDYMNDLWKYNPSTNQWTWVSGNNTTTGYPNYGTQGVAASSNVPGSRYSGVSWNDTSGSFWLFGGNGYISTTSNGNLNDLWKYDISTNLWTWMNGDNTPDKNGVFGTQGIASSTNKPGTRYLPISWKDASGVLWLFGGSGRAASGTVDGILNDLWKYDIATNQWTWVKGDNTLASSGVYGTKGVSSATNKPGARSYHASWTEATGNLFLFGGYGRNSGATAGDLDDVWKFVPSTNEWTWISGDNLINQFGIYASQGVSASTNKPGSREGSITWVDGSGNFWLFGGSGRAATTAGQLNDLWKLTNNNAPAPPAATTNAATLINSTTAKLNGLINDNGLTTTVSFDYGTSSTLAGSTNISATTGGTIPAGSNNSGVAVQLTGLSGFTTYYFRVKAVNSAGTSFGNILSFTTISNNADLSNLTISPGTLSPSFASATTAYSATVANGITSINVTPTASDPNGVIRLNGIVVASGSTTSVSIGGGVSIELTAADGTTMKTYTIVKTPAPPIVSTTTTSNITTTGASLNGSVNDNGASTTVTFDYGTSPTLAGATTVAATTNGTVNTGAGITSTSVNISGLTPNATYYYRVNGANSAGTSNGNILSFTTAAIVSNNNNLSNLTISQGTMAPAFAPATISYTATVGNSITSVDVTPTVADATATITINGVSTTSATARNVLLNVGSNTITTIVTAQDGTTKSYTITITRQAGSPLAVTVVDFRAVKNGNEVVISWETASELNNDYFEIERDVDGHIMSPILRIASKGNSTSMQVYSETDVSPLNGSNYYRLKQVDIDGRVSYSLIKSVDFSKGTEQSLNIYPNPAKDFITIDFTKNFYNKQAVIKIIELSGRIIKQWSVKNITHSKMQISVADLPTSIYFIQVIAKGVVVINKMIKQ